ncbi:MAG: DMT family transporter [Burkholderiaceae bacterium]|nr:DMT family transporter [Burkholderiaceae bacterium]
MTRTQSLFAVHLVAVLFGATGVLGELITADPAFITWGRAAFAVLALGLFGRLLLTQPHLSVLGHGRWMALLGSGAILALHWVTFFISVKVGGIAIATLGFASFPAFITLIEWGLLREKVTRAEWVRLWLVSLGLLLITPSFELSNLGTEGLLWGLLSGASFGVLAVLNRRYLTEVNAFAVAGLQNAVVFLVMSPWVLGSLGHISLTNWLWVAVLGVLCTGLAHLLFVSSLRHLPARSAGLVVALEPIYAIAFAWWFFSQEPSPRTLLGAAVIILTILSASLALQKAR